MNTTATKIVLIAFRELSPEEKEQVANEILKDLNKSKNLAAMFKGNKNRKRFDHAAMAKDLIENFKYKVPGEQ